MRRLDGYNRADEPVPYGREYSYEGHSLEVRSGPFVPFPVCSSGTPGRVVTVDGLHGRHDAQFSCYTVSRDRLIDYAQLPRNSAASAAALLSNESWTHRTVISCMFHHNIGARVKPHLLS